MTKLSQRPSERARLVRSWIMQTPRPHSLRCTSNGDRQTVLCGSTTWGEVASTALALNFDTIEALDVSGNVLRATNAIDLFEPEVEQLAQQTIPTPPPAAERERISVAELVGDDPESRRFALFAHLLSDAYRHANDVAFAKLAELSQQQATRASSLERSVDAFVEAERMRVELMRAEVEARQRELAEREEEDDDDEESGGAFKDAVNKIAKHVAKSVGADDEDEDDDDDDDDGGGEPEQPHAQPNGAGGH